MKERAAFMCIVNFPYEQTAPLCRLPQYRGTKLYVSRHREPLGLGYPQSLWSALCRHARSCRIVLSANARSVAVTIQITERVLTSWSAGGNP